MLFACGDSPQGSSLADCLVYQMPALASSLYRWIKLPLVELEKCNIWCSVHVCVWLCKVGLALCLIEYQNASVQYWCWDPLISALRSVFFFLVCLRIACLFVLCCFIYQDSVDVCGEHQACIVTR